MEFLKNLFNNGALTYEQFEEAVNNAKIKLVNIADGKYVSTNKYNDDLAAKDNQIGTLNNTIAARDKDLATVKEQLKAAGADSAKLTELTASLESLQTKYNDDMKNYQDTIAKQAYEFAVREFANGKKFTSNAAKRDFTNSMIAKNLQFENNTIIGADDFVAMYSKDNADAFVKEEEQNNPAPQNNNQPYFVAPTPGAQNNPDPTGGFKFDFVGVRPQPK